MTPTDLPGGVTGGLLPGTVREAARRFGPTPAFVADGGWALTYAELDRLSDEAAAGLVARGVGPGDLVALVLPSVPDYAVAYVAAAKVGAVTAGVNPRYTPHERAAVLEVAAPTLVLHTADLATPLPPRATGLEIERATGADRILPDLRRPGGRVAELADDPDRLTTVVFTSGTTGTPKGAVFGDRELAAISRIDAGEAWGGGGPMFASTQFAHVGFMTKLPWYLRVATTLYLLDRWRAADVLRLTSEHRMTTVGAVAPQLALMLRDPDFDTYDLSSVRLIVAGAAFSPPGLVREARERFGAAYSIRYSSTESGGLCSAVAADADDEEALNTVGRPRPGIEVELRDPDDHPVAPGEVGEICLRSPCMMRGYWRDPDASAVALKDGWLHTGDLARFDERGCLRMAGRAKEMFVRGGYNVYPAEVEAVLSSHPAVASVAIVPRPDPVMGEIGVAVVVPRDPSSPPSLEDLQSFGRERLAAFKLPEALRLVDDLPLTAMQKIDRGRLARDEARPESTPASSE